MTTVIKAQALSKRFMLGELHQSGRFHTLRDAMVRSFRRLFRAKTQQPSLSKEIWALKDVSFEIKEGEIVGIIGRNGAGKSTLLKILSRITPPTTGNVSVRGRIASLLEVGSGFHPELTGRENVFLNGAILGMSKSEIRKKFDAIVDFAEVARFIDTPVKHYSSGMYLRLAFSVAAHLDPDILIIDEVLTVGDTGFQRKCLGKMQGAARENRTVLVVTHHLESVRTLCSRAILLENGKVALDDRPETVLNTYLKGVREQRDLSNDGIANRLSRGRGHVRFTSVFAVDKAGKQRWAYEAGESLTIRVHYKVFDRVPSLAVCLYFLSSLTGEVITSVKETVCDSPLENGEMGQADFVFPSLQLRPGDYALYIALGEKNYERAYDIIDQNVDLPLLSVTSVEEDPYRRIGYFSMPAHVEINRG